MNFIYDRYNISYFMCKNNNDQSYRLVIHFFSMYIVHLPVLNRMNVLRTMRIERTRHESEMHDYNLMPI